MSGVDVAQAQGGGEVVLAPHFRGYAHLGTGGYMLLHSRKDDPAELCIVPATDEEKSGRVVGDLSDDGPDEVPAERMAVRLRFENVEGLNALEQQLRLLREDHFPDTAPPSAPVGEVRIADGCIVSTSIKRPLPDGGYDIVPQGRAQSAPVGVDDWTTAHSLLVRLVDTLNVRGDMLTCDHDQLMAMDAEARRIITAAAQQPAAVDGRVAAAFEEVGKWAGPSLTASLRRALAAHPGGAE